MVFRKRKLQWRLVPAVALALLASHGAEAARITAGAAVAPGVIFTDNVCLTKNDQQSDWIAVLTPSGNVGVQGRNGHVNVNGSVLINSLSNSQLRDKGCSGGDLANRDEYIPQLQANAAYQFNEKFSVDASGKSQQNDVFSGARGGSDDLNRTGNTNTYYRWGVAPSYSTRVGDIGDANLRYSYDEVLNSVDTVTDSQRNAVSAGLGGRGTTKLSWTVSGRYSRTSFDENYLGMTRDDTELSHVKLRLARRLNRSWEVNGTYGVEFNSFQTARNRDVDGDAWDFGVLYTPSERTSVSLGMGDRFFGETPRLDASHRYKNSIFSASYSKTITFDRDIYTEDQELLPGFENDYALGGESPILDERFTLRYTYAGQHASYSIYGSNSQQTRAEDDVQAEYRTIAFNWRPVVAPGWTFGTTLAYDMAEPRTTFGANAPEDFDNSSETWRTVISLGRILNDRMNLTGNWTYTDRQSDLGFGEYQENRIYVTLNIAL